MNDAEVVTSYNLLVEARLTKVEVNSTAMAEDVKEIKRNLRWLMGLVFSINTTIIGLLAKGFNIV
jgi:hypothetical protein